MTPPPTSAARRGAGRSEPVASDGERLLRDAGLRVTSVRLAVLRALGERQHSTADDVVHAVRAELGAVSVQAVYDTLHTLTDAGLLRELEPAGHPARFERRVGDNHHHLVCRDCGAVVDVDCVVGPAPCLLPSDHHGFTIGLAEVTFWGQCPECASGREPSQTQPQERTSTT